MLARQLGDIQRLSTERDELLARVNERDARIRDLEKRLALLKGAPVPVAPAPPELAALRAEVETLSARLTARSARVRELEARVEELQARGEALANDVSARDARLARLESELEDALGWGEAAQSVRPPPSEVSAVEGEVEDDLTRIRGIGPGYAKKLKAAGVVCFAQIAAWQPADVERVAAQIGAHVSRIRRDAWIESARTLAQGGQRDGAGPDGGSR